MKWRVKRILPWPRRVERKEAISQAVLETASARRRAEQARKVTADLDRIRADNHFAWLIFDQVSRRENGRQAGA